MGVGWGGAEAMGSSLVRAAYRVRWPSRDVLSSEPFLRLTVKCRRPPGEPTGHHSPVPVGGIRKSRTGTQTVSQLGRPSLCRGPPVN